MSTYYQQLCSKPAHQWTYLEIQLNYRYDHSQEIKLHIENVSIFSKKLNYIFRNHGLTMVIKVRVLLSLSQVSSLFPFMVSNHWPWRKHHVKEAEGVRVLFYRRILRVSWMQRATHEKIVERQKQGSTFKIKV